MRRHSILVVMVLLGWVLVPAAAEGADVPPPPDEYMDYGAMPHAAIPDYLAGTVSDTIDLGVSDGVIVDLDVSVAITHTWVGDLTISLMHVDSGTEVLLMDRPGVPASTFGCGYDDVDVTFDEAAPTSVETVCFTTGPAISGAVYPTASLHDFDFETMGGEWTLTVEDLALGDEGYLEAWALHFGVLTCDGRVATIIGNVGNDVLVGTAGPDVIDGAAGIDQISGGGDDDVICGGPGDDMLMGEGGSDLLFGEGGKDELLGGGGDDILSGGNGKDRLEGGTGDDTLLGGKKRDKLFGQGGLDTLEGDAGDDVLKGGGKADTLKGGKGDDALYGQSGKDDLNGGSGTDTADGGSGTDTCKAETEVGCEI